MFVYRFRSPQAIFGVFAELERQEIYFSPISELNDPMEGLVDLYWEGDRTLWENFFENYILYCTQFLYQTIILGSNYSFDTIPNLIDWTRSDLPTEKLKEIHDKICKRYFARLFNRLAPNLFSLFTHRIRRDELTFYLRRFHGRILYAIVSEFKQQGIIQSSNNSPNKMGFLKQAKTGIQLITAFLTSIVIDKFKLVNVSSYEKLFSVLSSLESEVGFYGFAYNHAASPVRDLFFSGPEEYVRRLQRVALTPWYVACFTLSPQNSAMWGTYASGHQGVCLKFRTQEGMRNPYGIKLGTSCLDLYEMKYADHFPEVNFFKSIGKKPGRVIAADWFTNRRGTISKLYDKTYGDELQWHKNYWEAHERLYSTKFTDWRHEKEVRLVLASIFSSNYETKESRVMKYEFSCLQGVIFGINTTRDHKIAIRKIIEQKCLASGRVDFEFQQAYYSRSTGDIQFHSLPRHPM